MALYTSNCFIIDPNTGEVFIFQLDPLNIAERKDTQIRTVNIPGASMPRIIPSSGGARTITFSVAFFAEDPDDRNPEWVERQVQWIQSLHYARVTNRAKGIRRITPVYLSMGNLIECPVQLKSCDVNWGPFVDSTLRPLRAQLNLSFIERPVVGEFIDALQARAGRYNHRSFTTVDRRGAQTFILSSFDV